MTRDWPLKLLALALAVFVWLTVVGQDTYLAEETVPLEVLNLPGELTFTEVPSQVTVRVRGPRAVLEHLKPGDIDAKLDLSSAKPGGNFLQLGDDAVRVPFGVELVGVSPPSIRMEVQRLVRKMVPVMPAVRGQLPDGYELTGFSVVPKEVEIEGAEEAVTAAIEASTGEVSLAGRTASFTEEVRIDPKTTRLRPTPATARVEILVAERSQERTLRDVPVVVRDGGTSTIEPTRVSVTLTGPSSVLGALPPESVAAYVDPAGSEGRDVLVLAPTIELPAEIRDRVTVTRVEPRDVTLRVGPPRPGRKAGS